MKSNAKSNAKSSNQEQRLHEAARMLIKSLGEETAAAIAAKCQVTYGAHPADHASARLAEAIVQAMGVERYNQIEVF